jgi:hypothetical protein
MNWDKRYLRLHEVRSLRKKEKAGVFQVVCASADRVLSDKSDTARKILEAWIRAERIEARPRTPGLNREPDVPVTIPD